MLARTTLLPLPCTIPGRSSPPQPIMNQTYGESPRSADASAATNCKSRVGGFDCTESRRSSEILGTWLGTVIVTGVVRPIGNTSASVRSPVGASAATSMRSSDQVSAPWKFGPGLMSATLTPAEGEISTDWIASRLGIATLINVVSPRANCRGKRPSIRICCARQRWTAGPRQASNVKPIHAKGPGRKCIAHRATSDENVCRVLRRSAGSVKNHSRPAFRFQ